MMMCLVAGWNGTFAQTPPDPVDFFGNLNNPVLVHGGTGTWDEMTVAPNCVWEDGTFYLFYTGMGGIGMATASDGFTYTKFSGNPVYTQSGVGFDSLGSGAPVLIKEPSQWVMYYNARQFPGWGPGESIGRATADSLTGTWERYPEPIITHGGAGEWDCGLISPCSVLPLETGGFIMFYYGSNDFNGIWLMGMATSADGIVWTKYDNPETTDPPFAESDPVIPAGATGEFDEWGVLGAGVIKKGDYYHMYYTGYGPGPGGYKTDIGFAYSLDAINWVKWIENPVYVMEDDPYMNGNAIFEQNCIFLYNSTLFMYYDYGVVENAIGMATGDVIDAIWDGKDRTDAIMVINYPNPVKSSTLFFYELPVAGNVVLKIYDNLGHIVAMPANGWQKTGEHRLLFDAGQLPAGIYYYRLEAGDFNGSGKLIKL